MILALKTSRWLLVLPVHDALEFALLFKGDLNRNGGWHIPDNATLPTFTQSSLRDIRLDNL